MYAAREAADVVRSVKPPQWRALLAVERFMAKFEYVPSDLIARSSGIKPENASVILDKMTEEMLLRKGRVGGREGYCLTYIGYDALALRDLSRRGVISSVGLPVAMGKESDVFDGIGGDDARVVIKLFRVGRTSFRRFRKLREHQMGLSKSWLMLSREAATKEARAYLSLANLKIPIPKLLGSNRHVIVMQAIEGTPLIESPIAPNEDILRKIMADMRRMFTEAKMVHNDLSPYNIILDSKGKHYFIDLPQWVSPSHPNADLLLRRDIDNIVIFFKKRGVDLHVGPEAIEAYIKGENDQL